ncbi:MAG TPA: hypothetical protein VJR23_02560 [Candidatus Acidoferrales bacterium]|nr:hypothetical protein [Candidatus Acidoferrales bacterium]
MARSGQILLDQHFSELLLRRGGIFEGGAPFGVGDNAFGDEDFTEHGTVGGRGLHDLTQTAEEFSELVRSRLAQANVGQHATELVESFEKNIHGTTIGFTFTLAHRVQNVFGLVCKIDDLLEPHKAGSAFNSVKGTKDAVEKIRIFRSRLQGHEILIQLRQEFIALVEEILQQSRIY